MSGRWRLDAADAGGGGLEAWLFRVYLSLRGEADIGPAWTARRDELLLFDAPVAEEAPPDLLYMEGIVDYIRAFSCLLFDLSLRAWMSEEELEQTLLEVARQAGREGADIVEDYTRPSVRILRAACRRVEREIQRLEGLARFSLRRDGLYSAPLSPDHNIVAALVPHFARRFGAQPFALVDLQRALAYESRDGTLRARAGADALALLPDRPDDEAVSLWRRYFDATANPARRNPALQRRLMPARYWRYLPEMSR